MFYRELTTHGLYLWTCSLFTSLACGRVVSATSAPSISRDSARYNVNNNFLNEFKLYLQTS